MESSLHFLITAGPTREAIDPVRFISNRSSGKMGFAIARAAAAAGHRVTLVAGPVALPTPAGVTRHDVVTAAEMFQAVISLITDPAAPVDVAIMTAAVADYRPVQASIQKIKKTEGQCQLTLERTRDILGSLRTEGGYRGILIGFAAETENVLTHALDKLHRKGCDLMVANDVSQPGSGFDAEDNEVTLIFADGTMRPRPRLAKAAIADDVVQAAVALHAARS